MINEFETDFLKTDSPGQFKSTSAKVANRAAFFGDGLFETMIFSQGKIRFAEDHMVRLKEGMKQLRLSPDHISSLKAMEQYLLDQYGEHTALRIRWNVYRDGLGKYSPTTFQAKELWMVQRHFPPPKIKNKAYISSPIRVSFSPWSHCKTLNALPYVLAGIERMEKGMDEVVLLDNHDFVSEAGASNIFWIKDGKFYTPSLDCGCIAGIGRKTIIQSLQLSNLPFEEGKYFPESLLAADQVFTSNVTGISYLETIGEHRFDTGEIPFLERLFF